MRDMKKDKEVQQMLEQIEALNKKVEYMEKEIYEIRKGNVLGMY